MFSIQYGSATFSMLDVVLAIHFPDSEMKTHVYLTDTTCLSIEYERETFAMDKLQLDMSLRASGMFGHSMVLARQACVKTYTLPSEDHLQVEFKNGLNLEMNLRGVSVTGAKSPVPVWSAPHLRSTHE